MKKNFTDKRTGISYTLHGDYYLPNLVLPAEEQKEVEVYGDSGAYGISSSTERCYIPTC